MGLGITFPGRGLSIIKAATGWGYGFTAGVTFTPTPTTTIGIGWRSGIDQKIDGTLITSPGAIAIVPLPRLRQHDSQICPDIVSLGIRQRLDPLWTVLATAEWSNWSRIGTSRRTTPSGSVATIGVQFQ